MSGVRQDLVEKAADFLKNPQVFNAPLEKKIEFLKSKGLNDDEINAALSGSSDNNQANHNNNNNNNNNNSNNNNNNNNHTVSNGSPGSSSTLFDFNPSMMSVATPPPIPTRDWKDYFIMATTTISLSYGLYYVFKNVVVPSVLPQSFNQLEKDKEAINQEFERVQGLLDSLESHNSKLVQNDKENSEKLDEAITKVNQLVLDSEKVLNKNNDDLTLIKLEIDHLKSNYKMVNSSIESLVDSKLTNINNELDSLRKLLASRLNENSANASANNGATNGLPNGGGSVRGIPSVSSVPSVSDILKNSKLKQSQSATPSPAPEVKNSDAASSIGGNRSQDDIDRSGVPAWQLANN
ncbi:Pex14 protein [Saccharomycopsis crataegensis]|uniref:Peroxisomal membrane protein PEX14 n=1 Tax=Saccharomycopsis crataegensis TaxID=43959 RepID=A0AAV5QRT7_9ASCO|nr:Pex14 protein [Saccharomycopsis crataegensis]